jgi:hypothetical protein
MNPTVLSSAATSRRAYQSCAFSVLIFLLTVSLFASDSAYGQASGAVQEVTGPLALGDLLYYRVPNLTSGQTLYVFAEGVSGNLDPLVALTGAGADTAALEKEYMAAIQRAIADGRDPLLAARAAADELFLAWDDDSGGGLAAAFAFQVPADGDYLLVIASALSELGLGSFGNYRLLIGIDEPDVLTGEATPTGDVLASLDREASSPGEAVQELTGLLTDSEVVYEIRDLRSDDTLYVLAETTSGELRPVVAVLNFSGKPIRTANVGGTETSATLEHTFVENARNYKLAIRGCCEDGSTGEYRLLLGVNEPGVLSGQAAPMGQPVVETAIPVEIGVKVHQIVEVDEKNEFFTAVASLQMEWTDPRLAFNPEDCDCVLKIYTKGDFGQFLVDTGGRWPEFIIHNQQGNRWTQNQMAVISQDGRALYYERFTTDFQVDFDFRQYPFDSQEFIIQVETIYPEDSNYFVDLEGFGGISAEHGEDEFAIEDVGTTITSEQASTQHTISRFTLHFNGPRHLNYYILQIFVPILLIALVSWVTFFLKDYGRRIEVASANLLLFIAFSFTLSGNYPRLGYVTLLDVVMIFTFVINALVVVYNVWLRRLEMNDQGELAERIDNYLDWFYPLAYVGSGLLLYLAFF